MKKITTAIALIIIASIDIIAYGQNSTKEQAYAKGAEAIQLMDNGEISKSLKRLKEAKKLDPTNVDYPYEMAYALYLKKDFKGAAKILEGVLDHPDVNDRFYQLLGNSYSMSGQRQKAITTYEKGLKIYPNSGKLYLERANMEMFVEEYGKAMYYFEKGINLDPSYSSNYYWASRLFCNTNDEVWGLIYGEIFMNLERNSKRTVEISKMIFDTYKSEINFISDSSFSVSFCQQMIIESSINDGEIKIPFCLIYEPTLMMSIAFNNKIDINTLSDIRSNFINHYFGAARNETHPNVLFSYHKKIKDAGHFDAYNHWILMKGDESNFRKWHAQNEEAWKSFIEWFTENPLTLDQDNKFYRAQY